MTRKDYVSIAKAFFDARMIVYTTHDGNEHDPLFVARLEGVDTSLNQVVKVLKADNPRFDTARFVNAAVLGEGL